MARRKQKPFGDSLEVERGGDELVGRDVVGLLPDFNDLVEDGAHKGIDRVDRMASKTKALIYAVAGGGGCLGLWAVKLFSKSGLARLSELEFFPILVVVLSCVAAYGLLELVLGPVESPMSTSGSAPFGGFVEARGDESKWKRRMLAVMIGIVHAVFFAFA